jgi:hypothetical protein
MVLVEGHRFNGVQFEFSYLDSPSLTCHLSSTHHVTRELLSHFTDITQ